MNDNVSSFNTSMFHNYTQNPVDSSIERSSLRVWFAIFLALSLIGILTNGLLFLVIIRSRTLRSGAGVLILHVITNCFITCAIHNPIHGILIYGDNVWFARPRNICKYVHFLLGLTQFANNWAEASLAVNRLVAIVFPFAYKAWSTRKVTLGMIVMCWLIAIACYMPYVLEVSGKFIVTKEGQCTVQVVGSVGVFLTFLAVYGPYGLVGLIIAVVFLFMYLRVCCLSQRPSGIVNPQQARQDVIYRRRLSVTKMLFISFLFDVMCMMPQAIFLTSFPRIYMEGPLLRLWLRTCLALQYPVTPVILFVCNDDYQSHLWRWQSSLRRHLWPDRSSNRVTPKNPTHSVVSSLQVDVEL
ncbi:hypothetical protein BV898_17060 [Hypsibius exemplaris]|uniref:G-protein coupled receptors family 1 profile domain-containing protein n=1 Tax=Hypsibius exemplaris TaxID=2072580 RepID=A0A9X6RM81_HYPEX|nr:hypothetical protein BV898_17060 [Hypsibius exemplaris]